MLLGDNTGSILAVLATFQSSLLAPFNCTDFALKMETVRICETSSSLLSRHL